MHHLLGPYSDCRCGRAPSELRLFLRSTGVAADEIFISLLVLAFFGSVIAMAVQSRRQKNTANDPESSLAPDETASSESSSVDAQHAEQLQRRRKRR